MFERGNGLVTRTRVIAHNTPEIQLFPSVSRVVDCLRLIYRGVRRGFVETNHQRNEGPVITIHDPSLPQRGRSGVQAVGWVLAVFGTGDEDAFDDG
jgi:hypothetical protein